MRHPTYHPRGSTMVLTIIVSIVLTALISAMCWVAGESSQRTAGLNKLDQAFFAAEAGAQRVQWYCKKSQLASISSPLTGTVNGDAYSVSWTTLSASTIQITAIGTTGNVSYTLSQQVTPPIGQPVIQSQGAFDNKNIDIVGDVVAGTNYSNSGGGSLSGNLTYYGTASNLGGITGTTTHASGSPSIINFTSLGTTLTAAAGRTYNGNQNNKTFDFTTLSGNNKVIYVNGNVNNPTILGSGTLYVNGNLSGVDNIGSSGNPINLVASGNITTNNNITIFGSLYTNGDWNRGAFSLNGLIYTSGIVKTNNGHSDIHAGAPPWFDPRGSINTSASTTTVSAFSGPMP